MRLVEFDQSKLLPQERFHANGFDLLELGGRGHTVTTRLTDVLRDLWEGKTLANSFTWEQKSESSFHLRPAAYEYSSHLLGFLYENRIAEAIESLTGRRLHLYHVQVVKTIPGPSYQDWHRDSYQFGSDPIVGAFPAAIKVNFYPQFEQPEPRLKYVRGSHRCAANDARFDSMLIGKYENETLTSSNERALVFESSLLHGVIPDVNPRGSIRVMYSFALEHEYLKRFASKDHHRQLHDKFHGYYERQSNDRFEKVEEYVRQRMNQGYDGNPYANDLEAELKYDGRVDAYEDVLDHIEWMKKEQE